MAGDPTADVALLEKVFLVIKGAAWWYVKNLTRYRIDLMAIT